MKLGARIFLAYLLIFGIGFYYPLNWILDTLRIRYLEGVEDPLADMANLLAELIAAQTSDAPLAPERLHHIFDNLQNRKIGARIYGFAKNKADIRVYITDTQGMVVFDSHHPENQGKDFSQWRDVLLTLKGAYGARSTRDDPADESTSVLYVAAPIRVQGRLAGVLTVGKPTTNINAFLQSAKPKIVRMAVAAILVVMGLGLLLAWWLTRPIKHLTRYARAVRDGQESAMPRFDRTEIGEMGRAFEEMREALEGRKYVEQYVQSLTHEIKSPLSAIQGAAELLNENLPPGKRELFLNNIKTETRRIRHIVERLLELAALESKKALGQAETIAMDDLVRDLAKTLKPVLDAGGIRLDLQIEENAVLLGNEFLLRQAVANLLQNAVDFSPPGGLVRVTSKVQGECLLLRVADEGPGLPDFALERAFDKFFSLERPDTGRKSTGLGLNFVKAAARLHGGDIRLENRSGKGAQAVLTLPCPGFKARSSGNRNP